MPSPRTTAQPCENRATEQMTIQHLTSPEQFVLWALRSWVQTASQPIEATQLMQRAFNHVGVADGGLGFHRFMCVLTAEARGTIAVRCPHSVVVMDDERDLLRVFSLVQNGHRDLAARILMGFVGPSGCEHLLACTDHLMQACSDADMTLRPTNSPAGRTGQPSATGKAPSTSAQGNGAAYFAGNTTVH